MSACAILKFRIKKLEDTMIDPIQLPILMKAIDFVFEEDAKFWRSAANAESLTRRPLKVKIRNQSKNQFSLSPKRQKRSSRIC